MTLYLIVSLVCWLILSVVMGVLASEKPDAAAVAVFGVSVAMTVWTAFDLFYL